MSEESSILSLALKSDKLIAFYDYASLHLILALHGIIGVLARMGLNTLTSFSGSQYGGVLWSNFTGCLVMGILVGSERLFESLLQEEIIKPSLRREWKRYGQKTEIPLYIGIATGLCGSLTSMSSFILQVFEYSTGLLESASIKSYPDRGYGVAAFLSYTIVTFSVSIMGFYVGRDAARALDGVFLRRYYVTDYELLIEGLLSAIGFVGWIVLVVLSIVMKSTEWREWTLACAFAPFGVYARYWLSRKLNPINKRFPLGTFTANVLATMLIAAVTVVQYGISPNGSPILRHVSPCQVVSAIAQGFCGNFSTVSSFVAELLVIPRGYSYIYFVTTIFVCFSSIVLILGTYSWTHGLMASLC
jgi:fluoride ion exporter CrcB/FEX